MNADGHILHETQALILAGGGGQRLSPLTLRRPKPIVSFGGIFRIIDFTLSNCISSGVTRALVFTQYQHEQLHSYINEQWLQFWHTTARRSADLTCLSPSSGKHYAGTADAVFQNLESVRSNRPKNILVLAGDHVYHMDYRKLLQFHTDVGAGLTISTTDRAIDAAKNFGVITADSNHRVTAFDEKPLKPQPMPNRTDRARVSMGIYVFKTETLLDVLHDTCGSHRGYDFGHDVIPLLVRSGNVRTYDFEGYWRDVGSVDSYYRTAFEMIQSEPPFNPYASNFWHCPESTRYAGLFEKERLEQILNAHAFANPAGIQSVTSSGVRIEEDAVVENSILLPDVLVGKGARLRRVIVDEGIEIPAGCEIGWNTDRDRELYSVTSGGVTVVTQTPKPAKPSVVVTFVPRNTTTNSAEERTIQNSHSRN